MKKQIISLLLMCLGMIVLCSCGDNTSKKPSTENQTSSSTITSGGSVTVGISQDLDSLDPHKAVYAGTREVLFNIYEGLMKPTPEGDLVPAVAESYKKSADAKTYTFTLRKGLTFHDGSKVTPEDVKYSIERYADVQGKDSAFSNLQKIEIVDERTINIQLKTGNSEFLAELTLAILPKSNKEPAKNPIGTGPFKVVKRTAGENLKVERFANYWKSGRPYLDEVTFKVVPDIKAAFTELQGGNLDILQYLTAEQLSSVGDNFNIVEGSVNYVQGMFLNNADKRFANSKVRQALCYALDKDTMNQLVMGGKSHLIGTNMIESFTKYYNKDTENVYHQDIDKAKSLLTEAGYPNGFELTITVPNNYAPHQTTAEVVVEQLKKIGVNAKIKMVEFTSWVSEVYTKRNYEATIVAVDGTLAPSSYMKKNVSTDKNNFTNYKNPKFDALYKKAFAENDDAKKKEMYNELQMMLAKDAASVYLQDLANLIAVNKKLTGYQCYPVSAQDLSIVGYCKG